MTKYLILYWKTKEDRSMGYGDILIDHFNDLHQAIHYAQRMVDKHDFNTVEVIEDDHQDINEKVLYGYDGIKRWGIKQ